MFPEQSRRSVHRKGLFVPMSEAGFASSDASDEAHVECSDRCWGSANRTRITCSRQQRAHRILKGRWRYAPGSGCSLCHHAERPHSARTDKFLRMAWQLAGVHRPQFFVPIMPRSIAVERRPVVSMSGVWAKNGSAAPLPQTAGRPLPARCVRCPSQDVLLLPPLQPNAHPAAGSGGRGNGSPSARSLLECPLRECLRIG